MKYTQTINLAHACMGLAFKKRAPKCIKVIKAVAAKAAGVEKVVVSEDVNLFVWSKGIRHPPRKIRVQIDQKEQDEQKFAEVSLVDVDSFKGLRSEQEE